MEKVDLVLNIIEKNDRITQRELAKQTSLSLGSINIILKKCLKKGLIMIEKVNRNNIRYVLTPAGFVEKAELTYNFVQSAIKSVLTLSQNLDTILNSEQANNKQIIFLGTNDDVTSVLKQLVSQVELTNVIWTDDVLDVLIIPNALILLWQPSAMQKCLHNGLSYINILSVTQVEQMI